jgi:hypothetical protein
MTSPAQMPTFQASTTKEIEREIEVLNIYKTPMMVRCGFVVTVSGYSNPRAVGDKTVSGFARLVKDGAGRILGLEVVDSPLNAHKFTRNGAEEVAAVSHCLGVASSWKACEQRQADLAARL